MRALMRMIYDDEEFYEEEIDVEDELGLSPMVGRSESKKKK